MGMWEFRSVAQGVRASKAAFPKQDDIGDGTQLPHFKRRRIVSPQRHGGGGGRGPRTFGRGFHMTASHTMDAPPRSRAEASLVPIRSRCRVHEALLHRQHLDIPYVPARVHSCLASLMFENQYQVVALVQCCAANEQYRHDARTNPSMV